jgi:hypothetical protein
MKISKTDLSKVVNNVALAMDYAAEIVPQGDGTTTRELTKEGLDAFIKENGITSRKAKDALHQVLKTIARRQSQGASGGSAEISMGGMFKTLMGFFETHMAKDGDRFDLSDSEAKKLGKTASSIVNKHAFKALGNVDTNNFVNIQQNRQKSAALINYLYSHRGNDSWISESDMISAIQADVASGKISDEFGEAAEKAFYYGAQYIYRGSARQRFNFNGASNSSVICIDMEAEFARGLDRLAGNSSGTGKAINAVDIDEAKKYLG